VHTSGKARLTSVAIRICIQIPDPDHRQYLIIVHWPTFPENFVQIRSEVFAFTGIGPHSSCIALYCCVDVGAGVDDVFVFISTFRQSGSISSLPDRMWHTLTAAGKATFFTSLTTAAAFAANIFSSVILRRCFSNCGDGGGGHWLVRMEWHPVGWSMCLPL